MKKILAIISAGLLFVAISCNKSSNDDIQPAVNNSTTAADRITLGETSKQMLVETTVYYNTQRFNVKLQRHQSKTFVSSTAEHTMYVISESAPAGVVTKFLPVIDALPSGRI
jgi:hypothetical protein